MGEGLDGLIAGRESSRRFKERYNLLAILGPTASGKTAVGIRLARWIGGEIISADSRQVYRGMDIGTGKDTAEYSRGGDVVPCHLIDIVDPDEEFSVFAYQEHFDRCFAEIAARGMIPLLVGGTGLYLDAVLRGYRMAAVPEDWPLRAELEEDGMESLRRRLLAISANRHNSTDLLDRNRLVRAIEIAEFTRNHPDAIRNRPSLAPLILGIKCDRAVLRGRITARLASRLEAGMIDEVRHLRERGITWERIDSFGLEYRYVARYIQGRLDYEEMFRGLETRIHQYAKRQETWFRRMERHGIEIHWIDGPDHHRAMELISYLTMP